LFPVITPADTTTHLCGVWGGGPLEAGQAIAGDIGAEDGSEFWAETTTEAAVKSSAERNNGRIISRSLIQHAQFIAKNSSPGQRLARLPEHTESKYTYGGSPQPIWVAQWRCSRNLQPITFAKSFNLRLLIY
jgi:hypothetical protein